MNGQLVQVDWQSPTGINWQKTYYNLCNQFIKSLNFGIEQEKLDLMRLKQLKFTSSVEDRTAIMNLPIYSVILQANVFFG